MSLFSSLAFWYIPEGEILTVKVSSPESTLHELTVDADDASDIRNNVREAYVSIDAVKLFTNV